jgi:hypothetical protein
VRLNCVLKEETVFASIISAMTTTLHHRIGLRVLRAVMGAILLYRLFTELPFALYLLGHDGIATGSSVPVFGAWLGGAMDAVFQSDTGVYVVLVALGLGALGLLTDTCAKPATALALGAFWMLENRLPQIGDGGDNIMRIVLVYLLFTSTTRTSRLSGVRTWFHNLGVFAIVLQVVILYTVSGTSKLMGEPWTNGTALYMVSQVQWFSTPFFAALFRVPLFTTLAAYATLAYQLSFPFVVFTRYRLMLLSVGIAFHLGIAISMGLVTFSLMMIALELFLIRDEDYARLNAFVNRVLARLPHSRRSVMLPREV